MQDLNPSPSQNRPPEYDYIFCGTGASASLLILALFRNHMLDGANVLLIDQEHKAARDKTFCFWSDKNEPITKELEQLISHSWEKVELPNEEVVSLSPLRYNHISSLDLYRAVQRIAEACKFDKLIARVDSISHDNAGAYVCIDERRIRGARIFDSRTPNHRSTQDTHHHIYQSFVGWMIKTQEPIAEPESFRFMDFNIDQQGFTQFVYVLPFSTHTALVEVTRFGAEIIQEKEAEALLKEYVTKVFGAFTVSDVEKGCIPMSNCKIENETVPGVTVLGARNYLIKPSTGYAFKNMFYHARQLAESISNGKEPEAFNNTHEAVFKGRFPFYDALLLDILQNRPLEGRRIFVELLGKVKIPALLKFLDEKTNLKEDLSLFMKLPWRPFLSSLFRKTAQKASFRPAILFMLAMLLIILGDGSTAQTWIGYGLLFTGLAAVGIPHGAVDHLLESGKWNFSTAPGFIGKYLLQAAGVGIVFYYFPTPALLLFLMYSAWHFGQADGKLWDLSAPVSWCWGASVLIYLLGTHLNETNYIVTAMGAGTSSVPCPSWAILLWLIPCLYRNNPSQFITVLWLFLSSQLPLLLAFGLYFIGQHSLTGWRHLKSHLQMSHKTIWLHSLPFHAGAWILLAAFYFYWPAAQQGSYGTNWGLFFIFIACISLPHTLAMNTVYRKKL